jgi:hypothetical protein
MSLEINDTRSLKKGIRWLDLEAGVVYVDCHGNYVMATDESSVVDLSDGTLCNIDAYQQDFDEFTPTKCKLEVFA